MIEFKKEKGPHYQARLRHEWWNRIDPRLRAVFFELSDWVENQFGKMLIITQLNRTEEENKRLGGYEFSAHLYGRGGDFRSHIFTQEEIDAIEKHLDDTWNNVSHRPDIVYFKHHSVRTGPHIHINVTWAYHKRSYALKPEDQ